MLMTSNYIIDLEFCACMLKIAPTSGLDSDHQHSKVNLVNIAGYRRTQGIPQSIAEHKHR